MDHVKTLFKVGAIGVGLVLAPAAAEAKGCIKGAIVGGIGGHLVGHGVLGAAAGCLVGRYKARRRPAAPPRQIPSRSLPSHPVQSLR